ncbi:arginine repressor [Holophaga foetida]|uniref:arginine repressor n=1 Tax=Holophaga foetida TaxID=35839 RepID=UPI0002473ECD|nr:transcriptional regulator, ArgR family [Holophaga foetida]
MKTETAILRLLKQHPISEQAQLQGLLEAEGIHVTQSTLSRTFRRLSVAKVGGRYQHLASLPAPAVSFSVHAAPPNLLVVRVPPGQASAIALRLDQSALPGLAGTIAGDDTILVVVAPPELLEETRTKLMEIM